MQATFAGQAEAYGNTFKGSQEKMSIAMGNLKETIGAAVLPVLASLTTKFAEIAMNALPQVEAAVNALAPVVSNVFSFVSATIQTVLGFLIPFIQGFLETVSEWWTENFATIRATAETTLATIRTVIETVLGAIQAFWQAHGDTIMNIARTAWGLIQTTVSTVIGVIQGIIKTVTALIQGDWAGAWEAIRSTAETVWGLIQDLAQRAIDAIRSLLEVGMGFLRDAWELAWNTIKDKMGLWWDALKTQVVLKFAEVRTKVDEGIQQALQRVRETVGSWGDAGKAIIEGLASGVRGAVQSLIDAITGTINSAISWAKGLLGIGSPSRVYEKIGEEIPAGLAVGIENNGDLVLSAVRDMMKYAVDEGYSTLLSYRPTTGADKGGGRYGGITPGAGGVVGGGGGGATVDREGGGGGGAGGIRAYTGGAIPAGYELGDDGLLWPIPTHWEFNHDGYQDVFYDGKWRRRYFSSYPRIQAAEKAAQDAAANAPASELMYAPGMGRGGEKPWAGGIGGTALQPWTGGKGGREFGNLEPSGVMPEFSGGRRGGDKGSPVVENNFYLTAHYGYQSETSLADDVRTLTLLYGGA
jgi:hypothetical protein